MTSVPPIATSYDKTKENFGDLVRRHRIAAGLSQAELAQLTGMSVRAIGDIERGATCQPRRSSVQLLEQALRLAGPRLADPGAQAGQPQAGQPQAGQPQAGQPQAGQPQAGQARPVPRQMPAGVRHFVGRTAELAALTRMLDEPAGIGGVVGICAVGGTAGVGKTALALHWAHLVAGRFPDGQLYVNLRGYDVRPAVTASEALAGFLRALGVSGQDIPPAQDDRAGLYRTLLSGRRMLVVLDNASEAAQVRPLLPGAPACTVVVTSRDSLPGLTARDGARRLDLDPLPGADAVELLRALIGDRIDAEPEAAAELAAKCCLLPLALRVAAELATSRPASPLAELVTELADRQHRLDLLDAGQDPRTAVRAVLSWSYWNLSAESARVFRLIALHPGSDLDRYAAAALTGLPVTNAGQVLGQLARAHLLQSARAGRYAMHDLLRAHACELAATQDTADERTAALTRLFDHYVCTASAAMDVMYPAERHRRPAVTAPPWYAGPSLDDPGTALAWLDAERASLAAVADRAIASGSPDQGTRLAATVHRYLDAGGYYPEACALHSLGYRGARQLGDLAAQADALVSLGLAETWQGLYPQAIGHLEQALALSQQGDDLVGQARALHNLGVADIQRGRYPQAADYYRRALPLCRRLGDHTSEWRALNNLAIVDARQGRYQQAIEIRGQALALSRTIGDKNGEAHQMSGIADLHSRQGRDDQAIASLRVALALYRETGDRQGEAHALSDLSGLDLRRGNHGLATSQSRQALALFLQTGDLSGLADARNGLGEVLFATGYPAHARAEHAAALRTAVQAGDKLEQARAHNGMGQTYRADDDPGQARQHWHAALTLYTDIQAPEADQIRACLATIPAMPADRHPLRLSGRGSG